MADDIRARIDDLINGNKVILSMKGTKQFPACGFSNAVVQILKKEAVSFETCNILADPAISQTLQEYLGWPPYPQLYAAGKFGGGVESLTPRYHTRESHPHPALG